MIHSIIHRSSLLIRMAAIAAAMLTAPHARAGAADNPENGLPTKRIVMYSSGVAFFERSGQVEGDSTVNLRFNVRDVNDLLKSMVLEDLDGGQISMVTYGSKDPITRTLKTFAIDLTTNPTLAQLLSQIRGEKIEIDSPNRVSGMILSIERRKLLAGKDQFVEVDYLNLLTDEGLRSVSLANVGRIKLANAKLDAELRRALTILAAGHSTDKKMVTIQMLGQGKRRVRVGYIQESPVWKTSYRLLLRDEQRPLLQGWAIVENTTEEDWKDVNLALVSGRPISFVMDLYQPLYLIRPVVQPELFASLRPRVYGQDLAGKDRAFRGAAGQAGRERNQLLARSSSRAPSDRKLAELAEALDESKPSSGKKKEMLAFTGRGIRSVGQAADLGELFRYDISTPVTLARQRSAMLPIINEPVEGQKVSIYNQAVHAKHPLAGLRLKNTTDLHIMQGPITVFDQGAYAGDAQIEDLQPGSQRLISYAMDLDTEVAPASKGQPQQLLSVRIVKGILFASHKYGRLHSYIVKNSGQRTKTVLIEYPLDTSWKLISPKKPDEKTRNLYRFAVKAEPGKPATLKIREERTVRQQVAVNNLNDNAIRIYLSAKVVSRQVKDALAEVVQRKQALSQLTVRRKELERQVGVIFQEQTRIRDNMARLDHNSDLYNRYIKKFNVQEDKIENLRGQMRKSIEEESRLRNALDKYLTNLDLT